MTTRLASLPLASAEKSPRGPFGRAKLFRQPEP
jgi:hypothetical protein